MYPTPRLPCLRAPAAAATAGCILLMLPLPQGASCCHCRCCEVCPAIITAATARQILMVLLPLQGVSCCFWCHCREARLTTIAAAAMRNVLPSLPPLAQCASRSAPHDGGNGGMHLTAAAMYLAAAMPTRHASRLPLNSNGSRTHLAMVAMVAGCTLRWRQQNRMHLATA